MSYELKKNNVIKSIVHLFKAKYLLLFGAFIALLFWLNWRFEIIALNFSQLCNTPDFTVLTWNINCSDGASKDRQEKIAELISIAGADFVQLNEYYQEKCIILDSLLRRMYPYTEEVYSHRRSGDIFYSKYKLHNSGNLFIPGRGRYVHTIEATISLSKDSLHIYGVHLASNNDSDENTSPTSQYDTYLSAKEKRCFETGWLKTVISKSADASLVMGDFNDFGCSSPCDSLKDIGMMNAWWKGGFGYGCTYHDGWLRLRIDHIFYSPELELCGVKVLQTELSDHNPIMAGFKMSK